MKERPLSRTQLRMLRLVRDGEPYDLFAYGMSERAGIKTTMDSLIRRELLAWHEDELVITAFGRITLREIADES